MRTVEENSSDGYWDNWIKLYEDFMRPEWTVWTAAYDADGLYTAAVGPEYLDAPWNWQRALIDQGGSAVHAEFKYPTQAFWMNRVVLTVCDVRHNKTLVAMSPGRHLLVW